MKAKMIRYLTAFLLMSLAWPLRGQFGHLHGALIPGAAAALLPILLLRGPWLRAAGLALLFAPLGFSLGGHLSYGKLFTAVYQLPLSECLRELFHIFKIGFLWGALGGTFLGFAFSEKPFTRRDTWVVFGVLAVYFVLLGILNWERLDIPLFAAGFLLLQIYNFSVKKSQTVQRLGFWAALGFGAAFLASALALNAGFRLRDQLIGGLGGLVLWAAIESLERRKLAPAVNLSFEKAGILFTFLFIPGVNLANMLHYWKHHFQNPAGLAAASVLLIGLAALTLRRCARAESREAFFRSAAAGLFAFLMTAAIAKEMAPSGFSRYETAYGLFIMEFVILMVIARMSFRRP